MCNEGVLHTEVHRCIHFMSEAEDIQGVQTVGLRFSYTHFTRVKAKYTSGVGETPVDIMDSCGSCTY